MKSTWVVTTAAPQISLDAQRAGELTFTVTNASRVPARAVFEIAAADGTDPAWFSVAEPQRLVQPGASVSVLVKVKVAADAAAGTYTVQGRVYSADEAPEEHSVLSGRVAVEVKPAPQPVAKSRPWWPLAVAALVVVVLVVVGVVVFRGGGGDSEPPPVAGATSAPPGTSSALSLDGVKDGVILADSAELAVTGTITIEAWIRPTELNGLRDIVVKGYAATEIYLRIVDGRYQAGTWDGLVDRSVTYPVPAADKGAWVHLAAVHDGLSWRLYRNGVQVVSAVQAYGAIPVRAPWAIGMASLTRNRFFAGDIDDVRIWNWARTPEDIAATMGHRLTGDEAGLVGYWYAERGVLADHTASGNNGTVQGAPKPAEVPPGLAPAAR